MPGRVWASVEARTTRKATLKIRERILQLRFLPMIHIKLRCLRIFVYFLISNYTNKLNLILVVNNFFYRSRVTWSVPQGNWINTKANLKFTNLRWKTCRLETNPLQCNGQHFWDLYDRSLWWTRGRRRSKVNY